ALYVALQAQSPVVLLSGHAELANLGRGAFQEMDQVGLARRVAKAAFLCRDPARLGDDLARAYRLAASGQPGPVALSLPADVLRAAISVDAATPATPLPLGEGRVRASPLVPTAGAFVPRRRTPRASDVEDLLKLIGE